MENLTRLPLPLRGCEIFLSFGYSLLLVKKAGDRMRGKERVIHHGGLPSSCVFAAAIAFFIQNRVSLEG
jgi:hypothetical protein